METKEKQGNSADFDEYRRSMEEKRESEQGRSVVPSPKRPIAIAFGIFMIIVFVGMGVLMFINFFRWDPSFTWVRIVLGVLLIIYGIFRGYRMFAGTDYYSK